MRFNKQELMTLATQPSQKFDKEGVLFLRERQEGFFRRTDRKDSKRVKKSKSLRELSCVSGTSKVSLERWCRLRGNLLFYFKSREQWSEPLGVIVLEQCDIKIDTPPPDGPYGFQLVFDGGLSQHLAAYSEGERDAWLHAIQLSRYDCMRSQLIALEQRMELRRGQDPHLDVHMWRIRNGHAVDPSELPMCEVSLACDNLLCDGHGRPPTVYLCVHVHIPTPSVWIKYAKTEAVERSSNPCFLNTVSFRSSDGLTNETRVRLTAYDLREHISQTATLIGSSVVTLGAIQDTDRLRIPLRSPAGTTVGFLSLAVWNLEREGKGGSTESTPCRSAPEPEKAPVVYSHRRSQSLPPRLGTKLKLPHQGHLKHLFASPYVQTYRFHSGLGGDISVHEVMAESKLSFRFPQQLLGLWIQEEKELLQEVAAMGELREPWHSRQVELLDRHLHLLHLYSQAKENLGAHKGSFFKPSARKHDRSLEFSPVNLHLQRMWVQNDTLRKSGFYDIITVGAFTAHSHKSKNGGLVKLLQQLKESPTKGQSAQLQVPNKISMAHDAIQAIKQLRREVVDGMRSLMRLAREKQTTGMLPICEEMITKTRTLLSLWDPGLVEEALSFVEEHKVSQTIPEEPDEETGLCSLEYRHQHTLSPYRRITQQLNFDLKSPDIDELVTPDSPRCTRSFWDLPSNGTNTHINGTLDLSNYAAKEYQKSPQENETQFVIFPDVDVVESKENVPNTVVDNNNVAAKEKELSSNIAAGAVDVDGMDSCDEVELRGKKREGLTNGHEFDVGKRFLDTQAMCSSPSANYYKPTDEPEPWDLTQLNIEASVMCLVSKVKFLCGRCGSPAVRLRSSRGSMSRSRSFRGGITSPTEECPESIVTAQPTSLIGRDGLKSPTEGTAKPLTIAEDIGLSANMSSDDVINKVVDSVQKAVNGAAARNGTVVASRNKFTDGLDFASIVDWTCELRPSMRKLRQAMDGLLKTARLTHSVFRVQDDHRAAQRACNVQYRRDVCFSQALTSLVSGLMAKLWCQKPDPAFMTILVTLGPLVCFEGLLSYCGDEVDMWGDMIVAVEDLTTVTFTLSRSTTSKRTNASKSNPLQPMPRVVGSRTALSVLLPIPDSVHAVMPRSASFKVTPVFFNIGINEMASLAESLGNTKPQDKSNLDNYERLNEYYHRYRKLQLPAEPPGQRGPAIGPLQVSLADLVDHLRIAVHTRQSKNVNVLHLSSHICRKMKGLRFTSCKSAKDRTGMSVTLEQSQILVDEYDLAEHENQRALDCMRSEGCRRENTSKNTGVRKYAFNSLQLLTLPRLYRPPAGTYGSAQT